MKKKLFDFSRKYWFVLLLNLIILIGTVFSKVFKDLYVNDSGYFSITLYSIFVIVILPICSAVYGCLSYIICKKIWIQQLFLAITLLLGFLIVEFIGLTVIIVPCFTIISIFASLITKFFSWLIRETKKAWRE